MIKRLFDVATSAVALIVLSPVLLAAAVAIRLSSPGPIIYRAQRSGLGGRVFTLFKFRTMHVARGDAASRITAQRDPRVFRFGKFVRLAKIDELPQLANILLGDMSIIGPRPEDPRIVEQHYTAMQRRTLDVLPGLASPGSIYNYTHGEKLLRDDAPEESYVEDLLPIKLALELVYVERVSLAYDISLIARTGWVILLKVLGRKEFDDPPEMDRAKQLLQKDTVFRSATATAPVTDPSNSN